MLSLLLSMVSVTAYSQAKKILMFVSYEDTYYSEYIVMKEAFEASGYEVDVRSAGNDSVSMYMIPEETNIEETANTLPGGSYTQFTSQFLDLFTREWNPDLNTTPEYVPVNGSILEIENISQYAAMVIVGGTGALQYRLDGIYSSQGEGNRLISQTDIKAVAEKLNQLALEFLLNGRPVMAQCHGASLPVFWRIPDTEGEGAEALGISLLKGQNATGFPEDDTEPTLTELGVIFQPNDRVTISSPNEAFDYEEEGAYNIITTRDWYPQTVAYAAQTLINLIETRPLLNRYVVVPPRVLILHGGAIDPENCLASNRTNDVPCNYGTGENLPADFTHLVTLLETDSNHDEFEFSVDELEILLDQTGTKEEYLENFEEFYDIIIFFKHWSTGLNDGLQEALVEFAYNGGGVLALHHGLYNDIDGPRSKDILVNQLFGAQSAQATWSASLTNYNMYATNYGHFISTYGVEHENSHQAPSQWNESHSLPSSNLSYSYYQEFPIYDEIYNNMEFVEGAVFGKKINEITPLFSNNLDPSSQVHTSGFVKLFDPSEDETIGRVAYFEPGERRESININHPYGQVIRNAVYWLSTPKSGLIDSNEDEIDESFSFKLNGFYPNPFNPTGNVEFELPESGEVNVNLYNMLGQEVAQVYSGRLNSGIQTINVDAPNLTSGIYFIRVSFRNQVQTTKISLIK